MVNIIIDILDDSEEEPKPESKTQKAADILSEADADRLLRKQVINIKGEIVDV